MAIEKGTRVRHVYLDKRGTVTRVLTQDDKPCLEVEHDDGSVNSGLVTAWEEIAPLPTALPTVTILKTYIPGCGFYSITEYTMDRMIARYLPDSPSGLRALIEQRWRDDLGAEHSNPEILNTVSVCLFILAELDGLGL